MKIVYTASSQLIIQSSFAGNIGSLLTSVVLFILGLIIFYFPELSHNSKEKQEVSMSLIFMGSVILLSWGNEGFTTWVFDKNNSCLTIKTVYLFIFEKSRNYSLSEINEVKLESKTDDNITSFGVKIFTKENKEIFTGFFDCSGDAAKDLASQISKFLNLSM